MNKRMKKMNKKMKKLTKAVKGMNGCKMMMVPPPCMMMPPREPPMEPTMLQPVIMVPPPVIMVQADGKILPKLKFDIVKKTDQNSVNTTNKQRNATKTSKLDIQELKLLFSETKINKNYSVMKNLLSKLLEKSSHDRHKRIVFEDTSISNIMAVKTRYDLPILITSNKGQDTWDIKRAKGDDEGHHISKRWAKQGAMMNGMMNNGMMMCCPKMMTMQSSTCCPSMMNGGWDDDDWEDDDEEEEWEEEDEEEEEEDAGGWDTKQRNRYLPQQKRNPLKKSNYRHKGDRGAQDYEDYQRPFKPDSEDYDYEPDDNSREEALNYYK